MSPKKALAAALLAALTLPLTSFAITITLSNSLKDTLIINSKLKNATLATVHNLNGSTYYQVTGIDPTTGEKSVCNFANIDAKGECAVLSAASASTATPKGQLQTYNPTPTSRPSCQWYKDHGIANPTNCS